MGAAQQVREAGIQRGFAERAPVRIVLVAEGAFLDKVRRQAAGRFDDVGGKAGSQITNLHAIQLHHGYHQVRRLMVHHFNQVAHGLIERAALGDQFHRGAPVVAKAFSLFAIGNVH